MKQLFSDISEKAAEDNDPRGKEKRQVRHTIVLAFYLEVIFRPQCRDGNTRRPP